MSLNASLGKWQQERSAAVQRNISHTRPTSSTPARVSTPQAAAEPAKRSHDAAFSQTMTAGDVASGQSLLSTVNLARTYLKTKSAVVSFDDILSYLSLPVDAEKNIPRIREALKGDDRVEFVPKGTDGATKDSFRYRSKVPVSNAEELKDYLARQESARGVSISDLKDGWPECAKTIDAMEKEGAILVIRNKKDNTPKTVYRDSPSYHIHIDSDFRDFWLKTKLPASEGEIRNELEKAGITPTSQVKEIKKVNHVKKPRKKPVRSNGKATNVHMLGILKNYDRR